MTFEKTALKSAQRHFASAVKALNGLDTEMNEVNAARMTDLIDALLEEGTEPGEPLLEFAMTWLSTYEAKLPAIPESTPVEVLRFLMETNGLKQKDLAAIMGGQPVVSAVLAGRRDINVRQAVALARRFSVSPALFVVGYEEPTEHRSTKVYSSSQVVHLNFYTAALGIEINHGQSLQNATH